MKPLRAVVEEWQPKAIADRDPIVALRAHWREIVGDEVAANSRPVEFTRDALVIVTRSSSWSHQLSFLSERVLQAVRERSQVRVERLRFRVGRIAGDSPQSRSSTQRVAKTRASRRDAAPSLEAALERFKNDVAAAERAKAQAGWKSCDGCGVRIVPTSGPLCVPCENRRLAERNASVARLLFEAPWLGYAGIAPLVEGLTPQEYQAIRRQLLRRWSDILERVRRSSNRGSLTKRERDIASSYVLLKSELDPWQIVPAVVRDLLGDELHQIFYGNEFEKANP